MTTDKKQYHAHVQIQYPFVVTEEKVEKERWNEDWDPKVGDVINCETLRGCYPRDKESRAHLHEMLDEYLDKYLIPELERVERGEKQLGCDRPSLEREQVEFLLKILEPLFQMVKEEKNPSWHRGDLFSVQMKEAYEALLAMKEADGGNEAFFRLYAGVDKH